MRAVLTMSLLASSPLLFGAPRPEVRKPDEVVVYRKTDQAELEVEIFRPRNWQIFQRFVVHYEKPLRSFRRIMITF